MTSATASSRDRYTPTWQRVSQNFHKANCRLSTSMGWSWRAVEAKLKRRPNKSLLINKPSAANTRGGYGHFLPHVEGQGPRSFVREKLKLFTFVEHRDPPMADKRLSKFSWQLHCNCDIIVMRYNRIKRDYWTEEANVLNTTDWSISSPCVNILIAVPLSKLDSRCPWRGSEVIV